MVKRVKDNNGFYEWYSVDNKPRGSGTFRGEAGVLYTAIRMFEDAQKNIEHATFLQSKLETTTPNHNP